MFNFASVKGIMSGSLKILNDILLQAATDVEGITFINGGKVYLVVGTTGAGKSTTINYLHGIQYQYNDEGYVGPVDSEAKEVCVTGDSADAVTLIPQLCVLPEGMALVDCPGFQDTRGPEIRVAVSVLTEAIVKNAYEISGMMVIIDWPSLQAGRGMGFRSVAETIGSLVGGSDFKPNDSILFAITKSDPRFATPARIKNIVEQNVQKLTSDISELKQKYNAALNANKTTKDASVDRELEIIREELHDCTLSLNVLRIISAQIARVIICDIFDEGASKKKIFSGLAKLQKIPKSAFDFSKADVVRKGFAKSMAEELISTDMRFNQIQELEDKSSEMLSELATIHQGIVKNKQDLADLESGSLKLGKDNPKIAENKSQIESNRKEIIKINENLAKLRAVLPTVEQELAKLDVSTEIVFERQRYRVDRSSYTDRTGRDIANYFKDEDADPVGKFFSALLIPVTALTFAVANSAIPFEHDFEYNDNPFTRVQVNGVGDGNLNVKDNRPDSGIYKASYKSKACAPRADVELVFYGETRAAHKSAIEKLRSTKTTSQEKISEQTSKIDFLKEQNNKLDDSARFLEVDGEISKAKLRQSLNDSIASAEQRELNIRGIVAVSVKKLQETKDYISTNVDLIKMIINLSKYIAINTADHPGLVAKSAENIDLFISQNPSATQGKKEEESSVGMRSNANAIFNSNHGGGGSKGSSVALGL